MRYGRARIEVESRLRRAVPQRARASSTDPPRASPIISAASGRMASESPVMGRLGVGDADGEGVVVADGVGEVSDGDPVSLGERDVEGTGPARSVVRDPRTPATAIPATKTTAITIASVFSDLDTLPLLGRLELQQCNSTGAMPGLDACSPEAAFLLPTAGDMAACAGRIRPGQARLVG